MDPARNPFASGAGKPPPHLAGRASILNDAQVAIARALLGEPINAQMLLGPGAVGKTVLLCRIEAMARAARHLTSRIDASVGYSLSAWLGPEIHRVLLTLSTVGPAREKADLALGALGHFGVLSR